MNGEELRKFRESLGMSQEAFGIMVGVTLITVHRWETGKSNPSPLALEKLRALTRRARIRTKA